MTLIFTRFRRQTVLRTVFRFRFKVSFCSYIYISIASVNFRLYEVSVLTIANEDFKMLKYYVFIINEEDKGNKK